MMIQNALDLLNHLSELEAAMASLATKIEHDELLLRLLAKTLDKN